VDESCLCLRLYWMELMWCRNSYKAKTK